MTDGYSPAAAPGSIELAGEPSSAALLYDILNEGVEAFPGTFSHVPLAANVALFRGAYPELLPQFEAARLGSPRRLEVARLLAESLGTRVVWQSDHDRVPLGEFLTHPGSALELHWREGSGSPGWQPQLDYHGVRWTGAAISELGELLVQRNMITPQAGDALRWVSEELLEDGKLLLAGRKIVMLGANAEMSPVQHWLHAGADVLWLDVKPPPSDWLEAEGWAGRVCWPAHGTDLLRTNPRDLLSTLIEFSNGEPVDLGLYAYAPGKARELRLTACMNALVNALPASSIRSVTLLVSPTTPTEQSGHDLKAMQARKGARPGWEAALDQLGLLGQGGGSVMTQDAAATRTVVGIQGASYQAAQYLGKVMMAECWARHGIPMSSAPEPLRVSATTAAITQTRSLQHPIFDAAFKGADAFGVETFTPALSRGVNGLLAVHDWFHPTRQVPGGARVHGGIHTLPYPLESALRAAAVLGFVRSPRLLAGLVRG